jgi:hypothetical protein
VIDADTLQSVLDDTQLDFQGLSAYLVESFSPAVSASSSTFLKVGVLLSIKGLADNL